MKPPTLSSRSLTRIPTPTLTLTLTLTLGELPSFDAIEYEKTHATGGIVAAGAEAGAAAAAPEVGDEGLTVSVIAGSSAASTRMDLRSAVVIPLEVLPSFDTLKSHEERYYEWRAKEKDRASANSDCTSTDNPTHDRTQSALDSIRGLFDGGGNLNLNLNSGDSGGGGGGGSEGVVTVALEAPDGSSPSLAAPAPAPAPAPSGRDLGLAPPSGRALGSDGSTSVRSRSVDLVSDPPDVNGNGGGGEGRVISTDMLPLVEVVTEVKVEGGAPSAEVVDVELQPEVAEEDPLNHTQTQTNQRYKPRGARANDRSSGSWAVQTAGASSLLAASMAESSIVELRRWNDHSTLYSELSMVRDRAMDAPAEVPMQQSKAENSDNESDFEDNDYDVNDYTNNNDGGEEEEENDEDQELEVSGERVGGGRWAVGSGRWTVDGGRWVMSMTPLPLTLDP